MSNLKTFNKTLLHFLKWMAEVQCPEESYLTMFHDLVEMLVKTNSKKPLENFLVYVYKPHKDRILNEDEAFFLGEICENGLGGTIKKESLVKALKMKKLWKTKLTSDAKKVVWKYFKALILLCELAVLEHVEYSK